MGCKFRAEWTSQTDVDYRVEIHDSTYSSTVNDLNIGMDSLDGFTLNYTGENSDRYNPILASDCTVNVVIDSTTLETFITDLVAADEDRFYLVIYYDNKGTWSLFWSGIIVQDMVNQEDASRPYLFQLRAIDGLERLKDREYPGTPGDIETFIEYIINCLNEIPTVDFWSSGDIFLRTIVNWYEDSMFTTAPAAADDPLALSRIYNDAFITPGEGNTYENESCYDVLKYIALQWNCVLKQVNGFWYFVQINEFENLPPTERQYKKDGTYYGVNSTLVVNITSFEREGYYTFLPMLQKVSVKYKYKQSLYGFNLLPKQTDYSTDVNIGEIQGGADEYFIYSGSVRGTMDIGTTGWDSHHRWVFKLKLRVGIYYLTNEDGNMSWSTTSSKRVVLKTTLYHTTTGGYTFTFPFGFTSPSIPGSGTGYFAFDFDHLEDMDGNTVTAPPGVTTSFICMDFQLNLDLDDSLDAGEIEYSASNTDGGTAVKATSIVKLPDLLTGDGPDDYSDGAIQVYDGTAWGNSDEEWTQGGTGTGTNINKLLCREYLAGQKSARRVYMGKFWGDTDISALSIIQLNGDNYMLRGGSFNASEGIWSGEWFEVTCDRTGVTVQDDYLGDPIDDIRKASGNGHGFLKALEAIDTNRDTYYIKGKKTVVTANYTMDENDHVVYANPSTAITITLPSTAYTENNNYVIVNTSLTNSLTVAIGSGEYMDGTVNGTYTLAADTSISIHNSGISSVGWKFLGKRTPK